MSKIKRSEIKRAEGEVLLKQKILHATYMRMYRYINPVFAKGKEARYREKKKI